MLERLRKCLDVIMGRLYMATLGKARPAFVKPPGELNVAERIRLGVLEVCLVSRPLKLNTLLSCDGCHIVSGP